MFNHHNKPPSESAEEYITALYQLVETCEYGELKEEMLRDRIVVGMRDAALSECLQTDAKLMLDKVKRELCKKKAVRQQQLYSYRLSQMLSRKRSKPSVQRPTQPVKVQVVEMFYTRTN